MYPVMLVDDDPVNLKLIQGAASKAGLDYLSAVSGEDALEQLQQESVSVLLTDLVMPGINGIELFVAARRQRPLLRGLLCSAHLDYATMLQVVEAGFDDCYIKPLRDLQEIIAGIAACQARQQAWKNRIAQLRGFATHDNLAH